MNEKNILTRILASAGTLLVWFPILAPTILSAVVIVTNHTFRFDYLMPAEFFPFAFGGGGLLLWSALRAHSRRRLIGWGLTVSVVVLVGGQVLAEATGLASGRIAPTGLWWILILASLGLYSLGLVAMGIGGVALLTDMSRGHHLPAKNL